MLLGKVIKLAMAAESQFPEEAAARDPELARRIALEAEQRGIEPGEFVADTISRFMAAEDGESWTTIVGNIQRADDPGYAFIETVMRKRLSHRCAEAG